MSMPNFQELAAKVLGLSQKIEQMEAVAATSATESLAVKAKLAEAEATIAKLKADAEDGDGGGEDSGNVSDAIKAIESAITALQTVLKDISGKLNDDAGEPDGDEAEADDEMSEMDEEAKAEAKAGNLKAALALRQKQLRKLGRRAAKRLAALPKADADKEVFNKAVEKAAIEKIASLGIAAPAAIARDENLTPVQKVAAAIKPGTYGRGTKIAGAAFNADPHIAAMNVSLGRKVAA